MSEFSEEKKELEKVEGPYAETVEKEDDSFESTVFSNPEAHIEKRKKSPKKGFIKKIVAAVLSVALLAVGTVAVIKLIPEKQEDKNTDTVKTISVLSLKTTDFSEVNVTNENGNFKLYPTTEEVDGEESTVWRLDGIDASLTSSSSISNIASNAASITASREVDPKDRPLSDFGLETPKSTASVSFSDGREGYSVMIGNLSPDKSGTYLKLSNNEKIYVVETTFADSFDFEALDLADSEAFFPASFTGDISEYKDDSGTIDTFDYVTVSGKRFPETVTVKPNTNEQLSSVVNFVITTPVERYAQNVDALLSIFTNGITVSGAYSFDMSSESLKKVGLDNPDIIVSMHIKSQVKTFKISVVDDTYCAVINEDSKLIKKVALSSLTVGNFKTEDYYNNWVCMEVINELSNYTLVAGGKTYSFDIKYNKDSEDEQYVITHNGKKLTASKFQEFYGEFVGLKCVDYATQKVEGNPDATITLTYALDGSKRVYSFYKISETKYQYTHNGKAMGKISALAYNKLIKNVKLASENKSIS